MSSWNTPDERFVVEPEHIKLIQRMWVGWQDAEFGAPEIDPKRPYGNSDVISDIIEILWPDDHSTWRMLIRNEYGDDEANVPERLMDVWREMKIKDGLAQQLHRETELALQVCLRTGTFEPGVYTAPPYTQKWTREGA